MLNDALGKMTKKIEMVSSRWKETETMKISDSSAKLIERTRLWKT